MAGSRQLRGLALPPEPVVKKLPCRLAYSPGLRSPASTEVPPLGRPQRVSSGHKTSQRNSFHNVLEEQNVCLFVQESSVRANQRLKHANNEHDDCPGIMGQLQPCGSY